MPPWRRRPLLSSRAAGTPRDVGRAVVLLPRVGLSGNRAGIASPLARSVHGPSALVVDMLSATSVDRGNCFHLCAGSVAKVTRQPTNQMTPSGAGKTAVHLAPAPRQHLVNSRGSERSPCMSHRLSDGMQVGP